MKRLLLTITLLALVTMLASAQSADEQRRLYSQAENDYIIGRLDDSRSLLKEHLSDFQGDLLQSAYRLLILCDIALDEDDEAQRYVSELLSENPYFTPTSEDPQRFLDMVAHMKNGMTNTITTAIVQQEGYASWADFLKSNPFWATGAAVENGDIPTGQIPPAADLLRVARLHIETLPAVGEVD